MVESVQNRPAMAYSNFDTVLALGENAKLAGDRKSTKNITLARNLADNMGYVIPIHSDTLAGQ